MKIAIYTATNFEADYLKSSLPQDKHDFVFITTGVGIMHATYTIYDSIVQHKPDMMIQLGIAGAYNTKLQLTDVVAVISEQLGDAGAEEKDSMLDLFDLGFLQDSFPFADKKLTNFHLNIWNIDLPLVRSLTVNSSSGTTDTIKKRLEKYNSDIENMEGAPFHYAALHHQIPFIQFRCISNYVEPRNKENWEIEKAIKKVTEAVVTFIQENFV